MIAPLSGSNSNSNGNFNSTGNPFRGDTGTAPSSPAKPNAKPNLPLLVRWMIRRDLDEVMAIENASFQFPWAETDFIRCLRQRNDIGAVAELISGPSSGKVVGFMIYELTKHRIALINFAVAPEYRRMGVGSRMLAKLAGKLSPNRRDRIVADVRERNLPAQLFFRDNTAAKFLVTEVVPGYYEEFGDDEDAYVFEHRTLEAVEKENRERQERRERMQARAVDQVHGAGNKTNAKPIDPKWLPRNRISAYLNTGEMNESNADNLDNLNNNSNENGD